MSIPRMIALSSLAITVFACLLILSACAHASAQQSPAAGFEEREQGIALYYQGDMKSAIKLLRAAVKKNQTDVIAWDYLALVLTRQGEEKEARKALKQVASLRVEAFQKEFDVAAEKINNANISRLALQHQEAFKSVSNYLAASATIYDIDKWWEVFNNLVFQGKFLELAREALAQGKIIRWSEVPKTKARIIKKPNPGLTMEARRNQGFGTIALRAILAPDGAVKEIRVVKGLGYGLTEEAVEAARQIKFRPATVGGLPVPQYVQVEYSFNVF